LLVIKNVIILRGKNMYAKKIEMIDVEIKALKEKRNSVLNEWVNKHHPCEIGAKVETSGCSYDGKQMSVQRRSIRQGLKGTWVWCATAENRLWLI